MADSVPDLEGWEAYCETCGAFREARRVESQDVSDGTEYFEFVCNVCHSILLTFQRLGTQSAKGFCARRPVEQRWTSGGITPLSNRTILPGASYGRAHGQRGCDSNVPQMIFE